ncbi:MAG TPA: S1 RNA-binding domain-containing protein, partial [Ilumatobacteraceae bacterium]|nr:S1 RNA-binding domain-containing protein [Ilumatobacteraceae bacterium]
FDDNKRQTELSIKAALPEPYQAYKAKHAIGDHVRAVVDRVSESHVNVRHSNGAPGVIHVSNLRWERVNDATTLYKPGDEVKAQILKFDDNKRQTELSIKAALPDPLTTFTAAHRPNDTVRGTVTKILPKNAFVDLGGGVTGSIFIRHVTGGPLVSFDGHLREGQVYDFRILEYDLERKQVKLARFGLVSSGSQVAPPAPRVSVQPAMPSPRPQPRLSPAPSPRTPRSTAAEGDSVEEATANGCRALGLPTSQVRVEVLDAGERGLFNRVKRRAKVRVTERI